jgi:hypothetical protein
VPDRRERPNGHRAEEGNPKGRVMGIDLHRIRISRICKWLSSLFLRVVTTDFKKVSNHVPPQVKPTHYTNGSGGTLTDGL